MRPLILLFYFIWIYMIGHCPLLQRISVIISFTVLYLVIGWVERSKPSLIGWTYAPGVEGVETKSQHNNSKSSWTSCTPLELGCKLPIPLEDTPTVIPFRNNSVNILPEGVGRISIVPITSSPSHLINFILWETFFKLIIDESGVI